ncbi:MAG TPA: serine/threonine-protein kinase [Candidatus Polarisedimenticolia bacterium]|nr:serine/threonine-protein kinase [Candidatus Polarisedimenticolia bacterium]
MNEPRGRHEGVAMLVADGRPVDWDGLLDGARDDADRRVLRHLRLVESVARAHREGALDPDAGASAPTLTLPGLRGGEARPLAGRWAHLELKEKLGEGAFGEVYRAWDPALQREVALKVLKARGERPGRASSGVLEEARLLARVRHPNVVTVHGAEEVQGRVGFWMELIRGRSLARLLREQGPFGPHEAALVGLDLCRALAAVHRAGLIHRDVKAENVMREEGGRILLTDFGAGIEAGPESGSSGASLSGTPYCMAPELFLGSPASPRSDVYSLGVLLYRLVTRAYPVEAASWGALLEKHRRRECRLLRDERPDLPAGFLAAVERALSWSPEDRFATAGEMERALSRALAGAGAPVEPTLDGAVRARRCRRRRWIAAVAVVGGLLAGGRYLALRWSPGGAPAGPAAAASPAAYSVEAALYRLPAGGGARELLGQGDRLALGDNLSLEFSASAPVHVYVINEDEQGRAYALFPLPGLDLQNPLPAGSRHRLPGSRGGSEVSWTVDSEGGREQLLVLASPGRLVEFEAEMSGLARAGETAVALPDAARVRLRGIGGLSERPGAARAAAASPLFELAERLAAGSQVARGVWLRRIELENPRR